VLFLSLIATANLLVMGLSS